MPASHAFSTSSSTWLVEGAPCWEVVQQVVPADASITAMFFERCALWKPNWANWISALKDVAFLAHSGRSGNSLARGGFVGTVQDVGLRVDLAGGAAVMPALWGQRCGVTPGPGFQRRLSCPVTGFWAHAVITLPQSVASVRRFDVTVPAECRGCGSSVHRQVTFSHSLRSRNETENLNFVAARCRVAGLGGPVCRGIDHALPVHDEGARAALQPGGAGPRGGCSKAHDKGKKRSPLA